MNKLSFDDIADWLVHDGLKHVMIGRSGLLLSTIDEDKGTYQTPQGEIYASNIEKIHDRALEVIDQLEETLCREYKEATKVDLKNDQLMIFDTLSLSLGIIAAKSFPNQKLSKDAYVNFVKYWTRNASLAHFNAIDFFTSILRPMIPQDDLQTMRFAMIAAQVACLGDTFISLPKSEYKKLLEKKKGNAPLSELIDYRNQWILSQQNPRTIHRGVTEKNAHLLYIANLMEKFLTQDWLDHHSKCKQEILHCVAKIETSTKQLFPKERFCRLRSYLLTQMKATKQVVEESSTTLAIIQSIIQLILKGSASETQLKVAMQYGISRITRNNYDFIQLQDGSELCQRNFAYLDLFFLSPSLKQSFIQEFILKLELEKISALYPPIFELLLKHIDQCPNDTIERSDIFNWYNNFWNYILIKTVLQKRPKEYLTTYRECQLAEKNLTDEEKKTLDDAIKNCLHRLFTTYVNYFSNGKEELQLHYQQIHDPSLMHPLLETMLEVLIKLEYSKCEFDQCMIPEKSTSLSKNKIKERFSYLKQLKTITKDLSYDRFLLNPDELDLYFRDLLNMLTQMAPLYLLRSQKSLKRESQREKVLTETMKLAGLLKELEHLTATPPMFFNTTVSDLFDIDPTKILDHYDPNGPNPIEELEENRKKALRQAAYEELLMQSIAEEERKKSHRKQKRSQTSPSATSSSSESSSSPETTTTSEELDNPATPPPLATCKPQTSSFYLPFPAQKIFLGKKTLTQHTIYQAQAQIFQHQSFSILAHLHHHPHHTSHLLPTLMSMLHLALEQQLNFLAAQQDHSFSEFPSHHLVERTMSFNLDQYANDLDQLGPEGTLLSRYAYLRHGKMAQNNLMEKILNAPQEDRSLQPIILELTTLFAQLMSDMQKRPSLLREQIPSALEALGKEQQIVSPTKNVGKIAKLIKQSQKHLKTLKTSSIHLTSLHLHLQELLQWTELLHAEKGVSKALLGPMLHAIFRTAQYGIRNALSLLLQQMPHAPKTLPLRICDLTKQLDLDDKLVVKLHSFEMLKGLDYPLSERNQRKLRPREKQLLYTFYHSIAPPGFQLPGDRRTSEEVCDEIMDAMNEVAFVLLSLVKQFK